MAQPSGWRFGIGICYDKTYKAFHIIYSPYHQSASYTQRHSSSNAGDLEYLANETFALPENFKDAHIESDNGKKFIAQIFT